MAISVAGKGNKTFSMIKRPLKLRSVKAKHVPSRTKQNVKMGKRV